MPKGQTISSMLPQNERRDNFQHIKLSQRSGFFLRIEDTIICFRDCLTFTRITYCEIKSNPLAQNPFLKGLHTWLDLENLYISSL